MLVSNSTFACSVVGFRWVGTVLVVHLCARTFGPSRGTRSGDRSLHKELSWMPSSPSGLGCFSGGRQKMDSLHISVAVHPDE